MKQIAVAAISGIIFGIGLALSQMTNPDKVLNFLDVAGYWDPSLTFVMLGALAVTLSCFRIILKRQNPVFAEKFSLSVKKELDKPLILGSAIFGIGWGLAGYCPGPVIAGLGLGNKEAVIMLVAIYLGFIAHRYLFDRN
jgi:uncharacterized protein